MSHFAFEIRKGKKMRFKILPEEKTAPLFVAGAGICWGMIGLFSRNLLSGGYSSIQVTAARCFVAVLALAILLLLTERDAFRIRFADLWIFLGSGIISIVFFNICYFVAIRETTLSTAAVLLYTAPFFVVVLSAIFFHERITGKKAVALLTAFAGCVLTTGVLSGGEFAVSTLGILAGIGSGIGYGLYSIFGHVALQRYSSKTVTFYTFVVALFALLPFCTPLDMVRMAANDTHLLFHTVLLGIISTLAPFLLYTKGLAHMEAGKASVMAFIEPMVATILGITVFQENVTLTGGIGILLIFAAVLLLNGKEKKEDEM